MDEHLRLLERQAKMTKDPADIIALGVANCRAGQHCYHVESGQGYVSIYQSVRFGCCHCEKVGLLRCDYVQEMCGPYAKKVKPDYECPKTNWRIS